MRWPSSIGWNLAIMRFDCEEDLWDDIKEKPFNLVNFCLQRINAQQRGIYLAFALA